MAFFEQLTIILAASLIIILIFNRLKIPSLLAYIIVGAVLGPFGFKIVEYSHDFALIGELGIVFLLFSLGLEFSLSALKQIKGIVFGAGSLQLLICGVVFFMALHWWGTSIEASILISGALALSSTAIVTRDITSGRLPRNRSSQLAIGILLFQDLAAIILLILIPVLSTSSQVPFMDEFLSTLLRAGILTVILVSVGRWLLPPLYKEVSRFASQELFVLLTLVIVLLAAWVTHALSLSMALGGFIIGMMLGENHFKHQIEADLKPFKNILLGLFFVTLGMQLNSHLLFEYWPRLVLFTSVLLLAKFALITLLLICLKEAKTFAIQTGLMISQAGEFCLALLTLASNAGIIPQEQASFMILIGVMSMISSLVIIHFRLEITGWLLSFTQKQETEPEASFTIDGQHRVLIAGFGRVGQFLVKKFQQQGISYLVIDNDYETVALAHQQGVACIYGDCDSNELLDQFHLTSTDLVAITFHSHELAKKMLIQIKSRSDTAVVVRCFDQAQQQELVAMGADSAIPEMLATSALIHEHALSFLNNTSPTGFDLNNTIPNKE